MATKTKTKAKAKAKAKPTKHVDPMQGRTRVLFAEPPQKKKGRPFVAVRVPAEVIEEFDKVARRRFPNEANPRNEMLRAFMFDVAGVGPELEAVEV